MSYKEQAHEHQVSRRHFLKGAALTAIAATAVGAGAASVRKPASGETVIDTAAVPVITGMATAVPIVTANQTDEALLAQLAAAQAENVRLQTELANSQQQLVSLQQNQSNSTSATEAMTLELNDKNERLGVMVGLVALYEQLDDVDLGSVLELGLDTVSGSLSELLDEIPGLEAGVLRGQMALDEMDAHIPLLQNGRSWLRSHGERLQLAFLAVEKVLQKMVERVDTVLEMIQSWVASIQKWLPFNAGQQAIELIEQVSLLLDETPHTISGLTTNIAEPLDVWLAESDGEVTLRRNVVHPLRQEVLAKSTTAVAKARRIDSAYQQQLAAPVQTAVDQQRVLRQLIADYRQQHNL